MARKDKVVPNEGFDLKDITSTAEVAIPSDPLERVVGQEEAVEIAKIAARQHRNLLLVGPPGTGKSMIALALSLYLPLPETEIQVVHNPENPERPFVETRTRDEVLHALKKMETAEGELVDRGTCPRLWRCAWVSGDPAAGRTAASRRSSVRSASAPRPPRPVRPHRTRSETSSVASSR